MSDVSVLPYRTTPEELVRWVEARARGRSVAQLRDEADSSKGAEGTAAAAHALGLAGVDGELSEAGRRFALASSGERRVLLRGAMLEYPPYAGLLAALAERGPVATTDAQWIEAWWGTHGYGSSQSNRREGAAALGRMVEWVGLGRYIPGRRGHATRIEWAEAPAGHAPVPEPAAPPAADPPPRREEAVPPRGAQPVAGAVNRLTVPLRQGREARLELPVRLPRDEKRKLLELLELLIGEE